MNKVGIPQNNTYSVDEKGRHGYQKKEVRSIVRWKEGLKSSKTPKQVKELIPFETDLALVQNIRFRKTRNHFQKKVQKDVQLNKSSDKTVTFANKTTNLYRLTKAEYNRMINDAITSKYKKASNNIKKQINIDGKQILKNKQVLNRLKINGENITFNSERLWRKF